MGCDASHAPVLSANVIPPSPRSSVVSTPSTPSAAKKRHSSSFTRRLRSQKSAFTSRGRLP